MKRVGPRLLLWQPGIRKSRDYLTERATQKWEVGSQRVFVFVTKRINCRAKRILPSSREHHFFLTVGNSGKLLLHEVEEVRPTSDNVRKIRRPHDSVDTDVMA